jgi:GTP pyrophosphokinase
VKGFRLNSEGPEPSPAQPDAAAPSPGGKKPAANASLQRELSRKGEEAKPIAYEDSIPLAELFGPGIERFSNDEKRWIAKAYIVANNSHLGVKRASGDPYITHPVEVTRILLGMGVDWQTACAGLLHDVIEDTTLTFQDLKEKFPDPVPDLVMAVTKISSLNFQSRHEEQVENLRKMILAMSLDLRVILIKLADRLHNIRTLDSLSPEKQKRIARTTLEIYAPLAGRLGIYRIKSELEDQAMRYSYPQAYQDLAKMVAEKKRDREMLIQKSVEQLREELLRHGIEAEVTGRPKHFWSIFNKMRNQKRSIEEIYDLNALRVICNTHKECYEILGVIHSLWKPVPEHFSDYIALPKANMYQSIHTKVIGVDGRLTEIQIRTHEMHRVAEQGIAAHWTYKEGRRISSEHQERFAWLRQMVSWIQDANDPGELLNDLKREAFEENVFCFTPKGDVIELTRDSTILDFAYRIHTDLGHRCTGGKINGKFVPLRTPITMGDIVEVVASKTPHPSRDWLKIATTARARAKIRHALKQRDHDKNIQIGRDMLLKALSKAGVHVSLQELYDVLELHFKRLHVTSVEDLFAEVGFGSIPTSIVVGRFLPISAEKQSRRRVTSKPAALGSPVLVDGLPGSLTRFAQCCRPQPGDPIVGFVTRGRGISVHLADCKHLDSWMAQSPDHMRRFVTVGWAESAVDQYRKEGVTIAADDRKNLLVDLTHCISALDIVIMASNSRTNPRNNRATARFSVMVRSDKEFDGMVERLMQVPGVIDVKRGTHFS